MASDWGESVDPQGGTTGTQSCAQSSASGTCTREVTSKEEAAVKTEYHAWKDRVCQPSSFLDLKLSADQLELFNPSPLQTVMGYILDDAQGKNAKKLLAKRRLDVITGNVASYSKFLNDPSRLEDLRDHNMLAAVIADHKKEEQDKKKERAEKKRIEEEEKERRKAANAAKEAERRQQLMPTLEAIVSKIDENGEEWIDGDRNINGDNLRFILRYYYNVKIKNLSKMFLFWS